MFSMLTAHTMSFQTRKIWISRENNCYELFDIDHIAFVAVIELKSVWKHLSVKTRKNQLIELLCKSVD